jgi:hypothetical protein
MVDRDAIVYLLSRRCFAEAAYFGVVAALKAPTAEAHMLAGAGCCGCVEPLANAQRLLEGIPVAEEKLGVDGLLVSPASALPYEGFFHLIESLRLDPRITAPEELRAVFDDVADDLAFFSRRELHQPPEQRGRYTARAASLGAAVLLRRMARSGRELPGVASPSLAHATQIIDAELGQRGGDAAFS